jgi:hypothetical protein
MLRGVARLRFKSAVHCLRHPPDAGLRERPPGVLGELKAGLKASLALPQYPGRTFDTELVTTSNSVATDLRAALVELHADNPDGKIWPGSFAEVHFRSSRRTTSCGSRPRPFSSARAASKWPS